MGLFDLWFCFDTWPTRTALFLRCYYEFHDIRSTTYLATTLEVSVRGYEEAAIVSKELDRKVTTGVFPTLSSSHQSSTITLLPLLCRFTYLYILP